jgi:hypothetical protein
MNSNEYDIRFKIFEINVAMIDDHNNRLYDDNEGKVTWRMDINQFTDRTNDERNAIDGWTKIW